MSEVKTKEPLIRIIKRDRRDTGVFRLGVTTSSSSFTFSAIFLGVRISVIGDEPFP